MKFKAEEQNGCQKTLILFEHETVFLKMLKSKLKNLNLSIFSKTTLETLSLKEYDICFLVQFSDLDISKIKQFKNTKFIYIFFNQDQLSTNLSKYADDNELKNVKIINLNTEPKYYKADLEAIFWFAFSRNPDNILTVSRSINEKISKNKDKFKIKKPFKPKSRHWIILGIIFILLSQTIFLAPLAIASMFNYASFKKLQDNDNETANNYGVSSQNYLKLAKGSYNFSKPVFHFLSIALPIERIFLLNESVSALILSQSSIRKDATVFAAGIFDTEKSDEETINTISAGKNLVKTAKELKNHISVIEEMLPLERTDKNKDMLIKIENLKRAITAFNIFASHIDSILALNTNKKYLFLFANNMELRPGGGFIGSYATLEVENYTIKDIKVFDVYDADGQLTTRVEPPKPISEILQQPFWYLRDSAFKPDFKDNFLQAEEFLKLSMKEPGFDGGALITTSAVKNMLQAMGSLNMSDYKETITPENFYLKTQIYAEDNFFAGSTQKKSFLSDFLTQFILKLNNADPQRLIKEFETSLNQKQIVLFSKDVELQEAFKKEYWSGTLLRPNCPESINSPCVADYLYQFDANLGVNKANFFIRKPTNFTVNLDSTGRVTNSLTIQYFNDSYEGVFPGGIYKNYFQLFIPVNATILSVEVNDEEIEEYDQTNLSYKAIGFPMTVDYQNSTKVEIVYRLPTTITSNDGTYQLIMQKQIGSPNYDFKFNFDSDNRFKVLRQNLSPLVNTENIIYNTSVSSDKIFLIEFSKNK
jgi:hypothetical protein